VLVVVEITDLVFAVDSIPAVLLSLVLLVRRTEAESMRTCQPPTVPTVSVRS